MRSEVIPKWSAEEDSYEACRPHHYDRRDEKREDYVFCSFIEFLIDNQCSLHHEAARTRQAFLLRFPIQGVQGVCGYHLF